MFIFKLLNSYKNKKVFYLNNYGNHHRDFTYINDVVKILEKFIKIKKYKHKVFNICSSKPINIKKVCNNLKTRFSLTNIVETEKNNFDAKKTHGDNKLLKKYLKYKKFTNFSYGLNKTVKWYLTKKIYKL